MAQPIQCLSPPYIKLITSWKFAEQNVQHSALRPQIYCRFLMAGKPFKEQKIKFWAAAATVLIFQHLLLETRPIGVPSWVSNTDFLLISRTKIISQQSHYIYTSHDFPTESSHSHIGFEPHKMRLLFITNNN